MAFSTILVDASGQVLGGLGKSCINRFLNILRDFPSDPKEGIMRAKGAKSSTESTIKKLEDELNEIIKILVREAQMDPMRKIGNLLKTLTGLRGEIESKSGSFSTEVALKVHDMLKAFTTIFLALIYDSMVIETIVEQLTERVHDDDYELDDLIKKLRTGIHNLEATWGFYSQVTADPAVAKTIYQKMKDTREKLIAFMEEMDNVNSNQMDRLVSGVVLKKPKVFGKKKFIQSLSVIIYEHGTVIETPKVSIPDIFDKISKAHPNLEFSDDDIEKAVDSLIESNRAFALTVENNIKMVEFKRSDGSIVCGNCGFSGGVYRDFKQCMVKDKYVCEDCISFWGKCKICGLQVKSGQHPDV